MDDVALFNFKNVDQDTINCVNGYIRDAQKLFHVEVINNPYFNIPQLINHICIAYYMLTEKFVICGSGAKISGLNNNIIESNKEKHDNFIWSTAFGNIEINLKEDMNMIYEWKFKSNYIDGKGWILYGIWSNCSNDANDTDINNEALNKFVTYEGFAYGLHVGVALLYKSTNDERSMDTVTIRPDTKFSTKDIITMQVNSKKGELIYIQNDKVIHTEKIDTKINYRMAVCLVYKNQSIELLHFKQTKT